MEESISGGSSHLRLSLVMRCRSRFRYSSRTQRPDVFNVEQSNVGNQT